MTTNSETRLFREVANSDLDLKENIIKSEIRKIQNEQI